MKVQEIYYTWAPGRPEIERNWTDTGVAAENVTFIGDLLKDGRAVMTLPEVTVGVGQRYGPGGVYLDPIGEKFLIWSIPEITADTLLLSAMVEPGHSGYAHAVYANDRQVGTIFGDRWPQSNVPVEYSFGLDKPWYLLGLGAIGLVAVAIVKKRRGS